MIFTEGIGLGHHISGDGIKVDKSKVEVISKLTIPNCQKDVRILFWDLRDIIEDLWKTSPK